MSTTLNKISQISIYLKGSGELEKGAEKVNEVVLFQPISKRASFDEKSPRLKLRKWTFLSRLPFHRRLFLKIKTFFFHHLQFFISKERKTPEAKFKTILALLLSQEELREFFLNDKKSRKSFFAAAKSGAKVAGFQFEPPTEDISPLQIAKELTYLGSICLLDDPLELSLQMATLNDEERDQILFAILDEIDREPITSVLEIANTDGASSSIELTTVYAKYLIKNIAPDGKITFEVEHNRSTSALAPPSRRQVMVMNQRIVFENEKSGKKRIVGSYSGELLTSTHILEQIFFMVDASNEKSYFLKDKSDVKWKEFPILFTSLFAWNEYDKILQEHEAIDSLHNKYLLINDTQVLHLKLYHQNLSFNALNKFPSPSETMAHIRDLNDEMLIVFTEKALNLLKIKNPLSSLVTAIDQGRSSQDYLQKQKTLHDAIDHFHTHLKEILKLLEKAPRDQNEFEIITAISALLGEKKLHAVDTLIYTKTLAKHFDILHHTNCTHSTDKSSAANAIEKALNAFRKLQGFSFLPSIAEKNDFSLFQVLYSMYLVWEEPELNAGLSTGFIGEKYFRNFIQKNTEATRYLTPWLKNHPQMYLALSDYRN